jgi:hypothetical protein
MSHGTVITVSPGKIAYIPVGSDASSLWSSSQERAGRQLFASHTWSVQCELNRHCTQVPVVGSQWGVAPLQLVSSMQPNKLSDGACPDEPQPATTSPTATSLLTLPLSHRRSLRDVVDVTSPSRDTVDI